MPRCVTTRSAAVRQPSAGKVGATHPAHDVGVLAHQFPDEFRAPVLDHRQDRTLVDAEIIGVEPPESAHDATMVELNPWCSERWIECVDKTITAEQVITVRSPHRNQC